MRHAGNNLDSRVRRFFSLSRHAATPRHFRFELNADGADYTVLPVADDDGFDEHWDVLRMVLEDAPQKLTRLDILDEWPEGFAKPCPAALWKWLTSAVADGLVQVEGTGHKTDPFRYWVAAAEERWRADPLYAICQQQLRELKQPFVSLREQKRRARIDPSADAALGSAGGVWPPGAPME
jgi:hypothetical protein